MMCQQKFPNEKGICLLKMSLVSERGEKHIDDESVFYSPLVRPLRPQKLKLHVTSRTRSNAGVCCTVAPPSGSPHCNGGA